MTTSDDEELGSSEVLRTFLLSSVRSRSSTQIISDPVRVGRVETCRKLAFAHALLQLWQSVNGMRFANASITHAAANSSKRLRFRWSVSLKKSWTG
ncbi:hypothetical protein JMJ77_0006838 [Colletotrichum scovillei]|uniref:Uncharacterized protein n=1 Tax=Colletotrichum scovillei TaxID=1209932 RepID=A0A9P7RJE5_9PEZI|nr:hypothetical protein JMJ77_0006838 [Colletotrichum scovillei]KAG7078085.1 hypothetical protein JMJ76_0015320 [Colletotrichum scovillei]KAG7085208.1 hypothetical protein JMJ78_0010633 [Colletotrichum scovillei]